MLFNSLTFAVFFSVVMALHYLPLSWRLKKTNLLLASYLFYAAWNPPFVALLWISTVIDWYASRGIDKNQAKSARRAWLALSLMVNLGMLGFFKYAGFALDNFQALLNQFGIAVEFADPDIILPVGISFYTFQTLSYTIDIYRGNARPCKSFLDYALYVTFFPQLVAGPIVRATDFLPQCLTERRASLTQLGWGLSLMVLGLFEKIVIADSIMARIADRVYLAAGIPGSYESWMGTFAFAGQIFCDFAGYSTCAIGVAMCLGFSLPDNFRGPYAAIGFSDFWNRWHISLSSWLRDYLYIPLGGNRVSVHRTYVNLMMTMLIGGLWHGASWTFIAWGALHGLYLVVERGLKRWIPTIPIMTTLPFQLLMCFFTFILVCITWVFFRARSFGQAFGILGSMFGFNADTVDLELPWHQVAFVMLTLGGLLAAHWCMRRQSLEELVGKKPWWVWSLALVGMVLAIIFTPGDDRAFIYFQF